MFFAPVTSTFIVMVALYWSGSRASMADVLLVVVLVVFAFDVFEASVLAVVFAFVVVVVLVLLAVCCWHPAAARARASAAAAKKLADGFKAKMCMRRLSSSKAARASPRPPGS
jgi:hypothetical protein